MLDVRDGQVSPRTLANATFGRLRPRAESIDAGVLRVVRTHPRRLTRQHWPRAPIPVNEPLHVACREIACFDRQILPAPSQSNTLAACFTHIDERRSSCNGQAARILYPLLWIPQRIAPIDVASTGVVRLHPRATPVGCTCVLLYTVAGRPGAAGNEGLAGWGGRAGRPGPNGGGQGWGSTAREPVGMRTVVVVVTTVTHPSRIR